MANNSAKSRSRLDKSLPNIQGGNLPEDLHIANAKLKTELQSERNSLKQLRREKTVQLKQVREEEHQKSVLIQKDLKSRLHFEKVKELEHQRDNLNKKFDSEFQKLSKFKDGEIKKLKNDVRKLQGELQLVASSTSSNVTNGLSANTARDTFESERVKLHKEIQDLQACKRNLESEVTYLREHDKKVNYELKKIKEEHASEVTRLRKEADVEVRKLLDELKSMHRQLSQPHLDFKSKSCSVEVLGNSSSAASLERRKSRHSSNSSGEDQSSASELLGKHPPGSASWTPKISDLSSKLKHLEEKCRTLEEEKQKLQVRLKEAGRKHRPLLEKNKKFLEKNMELTSVNRSLEDKIRDISQENDKLKHALDKQEKTFTHRRYSVPIEGIGELTSDEMAKELKTLQRQGLENDKTIAALKLACAEKDRRIELILHRKRKQRTSKAQNKAAGIKETYFGYDEADSNSVDDSEMSLSICSSVDMLDDEDVFEEFTREEFEANYQRLVKEHLELERSFAQLQESIGHNHVDPQRDNKLKSQLQNDLLDAQSRIEDLEKLVKSQGQKCKCKEDTGWLEEKEKLNKNIRALKEKLAGRDDKERKLNFQLEEINEQNEVLEFRTLELEEQCEKLSEQLGTSVSFTGDMSLSDSGILQMYAEEKGALEVNVCDLKESLEVLKQDHATSLSTDEKVTLVQSLALVDIADKKLKDFSNTVEALKSRIKVLEEEKAEILSKEEGVTTDLVLEYEATRNQLVELQLKCSQLENECEELEKSKAVLNYKETHFDKLEVSYKDEISQLKRRLNSASEGRGYENEVFQDKLAQLKTAEKNLSELTQDNQSLQSRITELQRECVDLHEQLTLQQDTLSLTESDKDTVTHAGHNLQVISLEKADQESAKKILELLDIKSQLNTRLRHLEEEHNKEVEESEELRFQLEQLEKGKHKLHEKVQELEDLLEEEVSHTTALEKQLSNLEPIVKSHPEEHHAEKPIVTFKLQSTDDDNPDSSTDIVVKSKLDNNNLSELELKQSQEQEAVLSQIMELQQQLERANDDLRSSHEELLLMDEEKSERIDTLQNRLSSMEENELKLSETVVELEEIEKELRDKVQFYEKSSLNKSFQEGELDTNNDNQLKKLQLSEQNLKDTLEQMSNNEKLLRDRLSEVEEKLQQYEKGTPLSSNSSEEINKVNDLEETVKELTEKESKLLEEIYKVKLENKELQDHIDQLIEEKGVDSSFEQLSPSGQNKEEINYSSKDRIKELEHEIDELKDQLLKSKLDAIKTVPDSSDFPEGYNSLGDLQNRLKDLENEEVKLKEQIEVVESDKTLLNEENKQLKQEINEARKFSDKLEVLQDSETQLMDKVCELEEENQQLQEQVERLSERIADSQGSSDELQVKLSQMRKREQGLLHIIETIKEKQEQTNQQAEISSVEKKEFEQLKEKVNILLDSESKLMDKIEEREQTVLELKEQLDNYKESLQQHELEKVEVTEKLKRLQILEEMQEGNAKLQEIAQNRILELEECEKELKDRLNKIEQGESPDIDYSSQNSYLEKQLLELESVVEDYEQQILQTKSEQEELNIRLNEYEDNEKVLKTKINELQVQNNELLSSVQSMQDKFSKHGDESSALLLNGRSNINQDRSLLISDLESAPEQQEHVIKSSQGNHLRSILPNSVESYISSQSNVTLSGSPPTESQIMETLRPYSPLDTAAVETLNREEMIAKIHELQELENFHRAKICDMKEHIDYFRQAVEVVAVALEEDAEIPLLKMRPKSMDSDFELRMNELVKSEVKLKLKVLEMEKREATFRKKLEEAEAALKEQQKEFRQEMDNLEDELNKSRKSEARFKNKLQYGSLDNEPEALIRIQELEEKVFDLEASETKLKRQLHDLKESELQLKCRLEDVDTEGRNGILGPFSSTLRRSADDKEKYWELLGQIKTLETSEKELKDRVEELRKEDVDSLIKKISDLERTEKGLKLKLELIEGQEPSFLETVDLSMLDSPEAILKQRIKELETMERHLKQQVGELEKDREELHEIARKDKNLIHELNVHIRELQLSERGLREQLSRYDLEDSKLHSSLDDLKDENEQMRDELQKLSSRERSLNSQLQKAQYQETDVSLQLENIKQDMKLAEDKLKKKVYDLEQDKRQMREKCDELTDRIGDLEGVEISLKQKLRHMENNETQLKSRIATLEQSENSSTTRITDLESMNEIMNDKIHKLEEDKSGMMYDVSSLQFGKEEMEHEVERQQAQVKGLRSRLEDIEMRKSAMQQRLDDYNSKEVEMHNKLQDLERCDKEWRDRIQFLEHNEEKLRLRIRELEANVNSAENMLTATGDFETEISTLQSVVEFHQQETRRLEADKSRLLEKLNQYEYAKTNDQMAMVPSVELSELRNKATLLETTELKLDQMEEQEVCLKDAIDQLRAGKDACGHEFELEELKKKADLYNKVLKAQALMRTNYEETKSTLAALQAKVRSGNVELKQTSSKAIQVKLTEEYTLKNLSAGEIYFAMESSEEFKNALKNLGARYPEAYDDFVKLLQPSQKNISHVNVTSDPVVATQDESVQMTVAGSSRQKAHRPGKSAEQKSRSEKQLWKAVEGRRSQEVSDEETDHPHWTQVEKNMGDTEEMTVTVNFEAETDGPETGNSPGPLRKTKSCESVQSTGSQTSLPPPLPSNGPPTVRRSQSPSNESYYLPSADEASEIVDEDDLHPKRTHKYRFPHQSSRAKSADRDSDFSEMTAPLSYNKKKNGRSLDSIPDDSGYQEVDFKVLKDKISYLEEAIGKKDKEILQIKEKSVLSSNETAEQDKKLHTKVENLQRQLETQQRVNKDGKMELDTRNREVQTLRMKIELMEKTRSKKSGVDSSPLSLSLKPINNEVVEEKGLKSKLEQKDKELLAKCNEVDRVTQELRGWQEDCRASKEACTQAQQTLKEVQHQADCFLASQKNYEELLLQHNTLKDEHSQVVSNQKDLEQASQDKIALEQVVVKLRSQLKDLERIEQERHTYEVKVKALETEVKHKVKIESDLSKENISLKHLVDSLQRHNSEYKEMENQYHLVTKQYKTMEEIKNKSQTMITPLRAKVLRLAQKCKHKNQLITKLSLHLRKYEDGTEVLREADSVKGEESDYNRPISPLSSKALEDLEKEIKNSDLPRILSSKKNKSSSMNTSSSISGTIHTTTPSDPLAGGDYLGRSPLNGSDTEDLLDPNLINGFHNNNNINKKGPFSPQHQQTSNDSIPLINSHHIIKKDSSSNSVPGANNVSSLDLLNPPHLSYTPVTLLDSQFSSSSQQHTNANHHYHPTGAKRTLTGAKLGTFKAVKDYDPSNFSRSGHPKLELPFREGDVLKPLVPGSLSLPTSHRNTPVQDLSRPRSTPPNQADGVAKQQPQSPTHFRVKRVVGQDGVLLIWKPPVFDELARSNGVPVKGYKIYIDNKDCQHVPSPFMSKALIERLNLHKPHIFTIQTIGEGRNASSLVETAFTDVLPEGTDHDSSLGEGDRSYAESSQGGSSFSGNGERRVFMAVYDYSANTSNQSQHSVQELSFKTGDVIVCYGKPREDGYYYGKVHGKKGLVPASFIEEVAIIGTRAKRSHSSGSSALSPHYPPSTSSSQSAGNRTPRLKKMAKISSSSKK